MSSNTSNVTHTYGIEIGTFCRVRSSATELFTFISVLSCIALIGNSLLLYIMGKNYRSQRTTQRFTSVQILITYNCLADLLFVLLTLTPQLVMYCGHMYSHSNRILCKLEKFCAPLPMVASSSLLVAISIDRFQAICQPLATMIRSNRHLRPHMYACIAFVWPAIAVCLPQSAFADIGLYNGINNKTFYWCKENIDKEVLQVWVVYFSICAWLLPSIISCGLYSCVCLTVWRSISSNTGKRLSTSGLETNEHKRSNEEFTKEYLERLRRLGSESDTYRKRDEHQVQQRVRTVKLTLTIVACNFFLWTPFTLTNLIYSFDSSLINRKLATYLMLTGNLNCCVNPWIYMLFNYDQTKQILFGGSGSTLGKTNTSNTASQQQLANAVDPKVASRRFTHGTMVSGVSKRSGTHLGDGEFSMVRRAQSDINAPSMMIRGESTPTVGIHNSEAVSISTGDDTKTHVLLSDQVTHVLLSDQVIERKQSNKVRFGDHKLADL